MSSFILEPQKFVPVNNQVRTSLASDAVAVQTELATENADSFVANYWLVIDPGEKIKEPRQVASVSVANITLTSSLSFKHLGGVKVWMLRGNQLKLYRAQNVE